MNLIDGQIVDIWFFSGDQIFIEKMEQTVQAMAHAISFMEESLNEIPVCGVPIFGFQSSNQCDDMFIHGLYINHRLPDPVLVSDFQLNPNQLMEIILAQNRRLPAISLWE